MVAPITSPSVAGQDALALILDVVFNAHQSVAPKTIVATNPRNMRFMRGHQFCILE